MRNYPTDDRDHAALVKLNAEPWMVECLKLSPVYTAWGPGEDFMTTHGESWSTSQEVATWSAFGPWALDALNEVVNFYFELSRASEDCPECCGVGESMCERCAFCDGDGYQFTAPAASLGVVLWFLHPRKGCSRGVRVERIEQEELPAVLRYLAEAAKRNADRFKVLR